LQLSFSSGKFIFLVHLCKTKWIESKIKMIMKKIVNVAMVALVASSGFFYTSCSNESTTRLEVRLTDSPGDFGEVNIDIQEVQVNTSTGNSGWVSLDIEAGVYNILKLTNGIDTLLGGVELPAGKVEQIRLVLGANNSVKVNGTTHAMTTPSAQQSGLKLNLHADLVEGITYKILLDFDAARSIVVHGNGTYSLKPVIRAIEEATSGAIKGTVSPIDATPAVYAIVGSDTVGTAFTDELGKFLLKGLPAGTYLVSLQPKDGFATVDKTDVEVTVGNVTDLGTIEF
jgi:Domain of unknown function (DUF4382)